jgi:cytochrome c biogenesis protein
VNVEVGGLARTDNSGWGDEFERLTERLLAGHGADRPEAASTSRRSAQVDVK